MKVSMELLAKTFPNVPFYTFMLTVKKRLNGCESLLDVGCGKKSPLALLHFPYSVGLDGYKPNVTSAKKNKTHTKIVLGDARHIQRLFSPKTFDAVAALDVIEHLSKKEGLVLLKNMERIATKKVLIFTPNGFVAQHRHGDDLEEHLSGWDHHDFKRLGYRVYGIYGLKLFRGEDYGIRFSPKFFWGLISELSNSFYTFYHPESAVALLCVKNVKRNKK